MSPAPRPLLAATLVTATLLGCATAPREPDYAPVAQAVRVATGAPALFDPADPAEPPSAQDLFAGGLTMQAAVEHALLTNPSLQAALREVGIRTADRAQAGLLANPSLSMALRFPEGGGKVGLEGGLFTSLVDLTQRPARQALADRALEHARLDAARAAVALADQVRVAFVQARAAERQLTIARTNHAVTGRLVDLVTARLDLGAATVLELDLAELERLEAEYAVATAELARTRTRRELSALLGFATPPTEFRLRDPLADSAALDANEALTDLANHHTQVLTERALAARLDLQAAHAWLAAATADLERQHGLKVRVLDVGLEAERENNWSLGPGFRLQLPLFDRNQAQIARAVEVVEQRAAHLRAVQLTARVDVTAALDTLRGELAAAALRDRQVARAETTLEHARTSYEQGGTTLVTVLEAQRQLQGARSATVERQRAVALALVELERAVGLPRADWLAASNPAQPDAQASDTAALNAEPAQ